MKEFLVIYSIISFKVDLKGRKAYNIQNIFCATALEAEYVPFIYPSYISDVRKVTQLYPRFLLSSPAGFEYSILRRTKY